ncbi:hypothetical protein MKW94_005200 [Papaver nudicaule]|uniref:RING-type domain-containing protein n=1 Tax=Papaver nudicaule TaxID=74823 RepID=A0AA41V6H5_PAPNU|nr:hypothetical protein [Papaver nudicaule]
MCFPFFVREIPHLILVCFSRLLNCIMLTLFQPIEHCFRLLTLQLFDVIQSQDTDLSSAAEIQDTATLWPWAAPLPTYRISTYMLEPLKEKLPVIKLGEFLDKSTSSSSSTNKDESVTCTVCLNQLQIMEEIRELSNCSHVFHKECLDMWIDQYHFTCPLCRAKLDSAQGYLGYDEDDPWSAERLQFLYGGDDNP